MRSLMIHGANTNLFVVLKTEEGIDFEVYEGKSGYNENLAGLCQTLMDKHAFTPSMLDWAGIGLGPGSFTSKRVTLSFIKGLSYALRIPLIGFSTFALWREYVKASDCIGDEPMLLLSDSKKGHYYADFECFGTTYTWDCSSAELEAAIRNICGRSFSVKVSGPSTERFLADLNLLPSSNEKIEWKVLSHPEEEQLVTAMYKVCLQLLEAENFMKAFDGPLYFWRDREKLESGQDN